MSKIDDKHRALKRAGQDLGTARGPEKSAGSGGRFREYARGNIYFHPNTGAHEVHGSILKTYLAHCGPGKDPETGQRMFGYPMTDEHRTRDGKYPTSSFEWAEITWVSGVGAGVATHETHKYWKRKGEEIGPLGHPISEPINVAGGQAAFFEYGLVYTGSRSHNLPTPAMYGFPRIGQPYLAGADARMFRLKDAISIQAPSNFRGSAKRLRQAFEQVIERRFAIRPTGLKSAANIPLFVKSKTSNRGGRRDLGLKTAPTDRTLYDIDVPLWPDPTVSNYKSHNLTEAEAKKIQGGKKPTVSGDRAISMVKVDKKNPVFFRRMVNDASYIIRLGKNRIVMIDSRWDRGILEGTWDALKNKAGFGSTDERNFADGHPNSEGFAAGDIALVKKALTEAANGGSVIVGVHAPPLNTAGNEYPHFFRETIRPHADRKDIEAFLRRQAQWVGARKHDPISNRWIYPKGWLTKNVGYLKKGGKKGLDYGVSKSRVEHFLKLCAGDNAPRAVDAVLCGHVHRNVEYRIEYSVKEKFRFYSDFYTENPTRFYTSKTAKDKLYIRVKPGAKVNDKPTRVSEHRDGKAVVFKQLDAPPYSTPLATSRVKPGGGANTDH